MTIFPVSLLRTRSVTPPAANGVTRDFTLGPIGGVVGDAGASSGGGTKVSYEIEYADLLFAPNGQIGLYLLKTYQGGVPWATMVNNVSYTMRIHVMDVAGTGIYISQILIKNGNNTGGISNAQLTAAIGGYVEITRISGSDPDYFFSMLVSGGPSGGALMLSKIELFPS